jgi:molybdopterin synthase catalytic subunit
MPLIRIEYDNVPESEIKNLSESVRDIVSKVTGIEDVFVYANSSQIKVKVAPIEVFVEMSAHKISNIDELVGKIKNEISIWKKSSGFEYPINLSLIPMPWKVEVGI